VEEVMRQTRDLAEEVMRRQVQIEWLASKPGAQERTVVV
jgi:hypothetical protein